MNLEHINSSAGNINGVINIYKEKGYTSHDVVAKLRGITKIKKIGHTGTLDPDAEGVLPVCIGNATKLCDFIMEKDKEYRAQLILGKETDTQDISGKVLRQSEYYKSLTEEKIRETIYHFMGEYEQLPPMYSAIKVNGKKLYELARQGIEVERKKRKITIYSIDILSLELPMIEIKVRCSRGTYIRTLCNDIGVRLGTYGCMGDLLRTASGRFKIEDSIRLDSVEKLFHELRELPVLIPTENILSDLPGISLKEKYTKLLMNGNRLAPDMFLDCDKINTDNELYRVYDDTGKFVAVYRNETNQGTLKPEKMFI